MLHINKNQNQECKMTAEKNEEMPKSIGSIDDLLWLIEHSEMFKYHMLFSGARFLLENRDIIKKDIQLSIKERKEMK
jgi:hypothetical protein